MRYRFWFQTKNLGPGQNPICVYICESVYVCAPNATKINKYGLAHQRGSKKLWQDTTEPMKKKSNRKSVMLNAEQRVNIAFSVFRGVTRISGYSLQRSLLLLSLIEWKINIVYHRHWHWPHYHRNGRYIYTRPRIHTRTNTLTYHK